MPKSAKKTSLKEFVNSSGFYLNFGVNKIERDSLLSFSDVEPTKNSIVLMKKDQIPDHDNIEFFRGTATTGDKNGNGYVIETEAWDWNRYKDNPQILWQHQDDKPIGKAIRLIKNDNSWDIEFFVDYNTMEEKEAYRIRNGYVNGLSTGHLTHELHFENSKGEKLTEQEYIEKWWNGEDLSDFVMHITKAEGFENSMVTLPSNAKTYTVKNAIDRYFVNFKQNLMSKKEILDAEKLETKTNEQEEVKSTEAEAVADSTVESSVEETQASESVSGEVPEEPKTETENVEEEGKAEDTEEPKSSEDNSVAEAVVSLAEVVANMQTQINDLVGYIAKARKEPSENKVLQLQTQLVDSKDKKSDSITSLVASIKKNQAESKLRLPLR